MPKIEMTVRNTRTGNLTVETYTITQEDPRKWAEETIDSFNRTLRTGEAPRELVDVCALDTTEHYYPHEWSKKSIVTVVKGGTRPHDVYRCSRCGITGKRFGLDETIQRDYRYRNAKYEQCIAGGGNQ